MPRIDLTSAQLSQLLVAGTALSFDIVELLDNIQNEEIRNEKFLAYFVLVFSSFSLLQLLQLTEALASRVLLSRRWQIFWTVYGVTFHEVPFLIFRIYTMSAFGFEIIQLIFPLKNAFSILFGLYHVYALRKMEMKQFKSKTFRKASTSTMISMTLSEMSSTVHGEDQTERTGSLVFRNKLTLWARKRHLFRLVAPILLLFTHLILLIWRITVVHDDSRFWLLLLTALPFIVITIPRIIQHKLDIDSKKMKVSVWYQPLVLYLTVAISCYWLIILALVEDNRFLSYNNLTFVCNTAKQEGNVTPVCNISIDDSSDPKLIDERSYGLLQLILPLVVFGRFFMPREGLSPESFSNLLQLAIAMAFDISDFAHLIVDEPTLHKDRTELIAMLLFSSTSILLLVQMDVGLASDRKVSEIVWTGLAVLFLDGPFFIMRLFIALEYGTDDLQLVFVLKNAFGVVFGSYRVLTLLINKESDEKGKEELNGPPHCMPQDNAEEETVFADVHTEENDKSIDMHSTGHTAQDDKEDTVFETLCIEEKDKCNGCSSNKGLNTQSAAHVPQQDTEEHVLVVNPYIQEKDESSSHLECPDVHSSDQVPQSNTNEIQVISNYHTEEYEESNPDSTDILHTCGTEARLFTNPYIKGKDDCTSHPGHSTLDNGHYREDILDSYSNGNSQREEEMNQEMPVPQERLAKPQESKDNPDRCEPCLA
jgi:hypothetical protein